MTKRSEKKKSIKKDTLALCSAVDDINIKVTYGRLQRLTLQLRLHQTRGDY